MQMIKFTHACVRLHDGDRALLLDPGIWSEREVFDGVSDVLVTHEHYDHVDVERLTAAHQANPGLRVYAPDPIARKLQQELGAAAVTTVVVGQRFTAAGFTVNAVGGAHAEIYDGLPGCANVGYVVGTGGQTVYHPGDSLFVPDTHVDVLLLPVAGPWFKISEGLDFVRAVAPQRALPIHDHPLKEDIGWSGVDGWMDMKSQTKYTRAPIGELVDL